MTAQFTPRAQAVIDDSDEYTAPIFRAPSVGCLGRALAMRVLQSDLYHQLDDREKAECDALLPRRAAIAATAATGEAS